jgi:hypothetical protein
MFERVYRRFGLDFSYVDLTDPARLEAALTPATRLVWLESPSNPLMKLVDIAAVAAIARRSGALVAVDNTFLSPCFQRPLELGADLVMHSTTKYIGGHSDLVGGAVVVADDELGERLAFLSNATGGIQSTFDAWLCLGRDPHLRHIVDVFQQHGFQREQMTFNGAFAGQNPTEQMDMNELFGVRIKAVIVTDARGICSPASDHGLETQAGENSQRRRQGFSVDEQIEINLADGRLGQIDVALPMAVNNLFAIESIDQPFD